MLDRLIQYGNVSDIARSELFDQDTFYKTFIRDISLCRSELIIECPFITQRRISQLLPSLQKALRRGVSVTVNTKPLNEHDAYFQAEAEEAIPVLQELGVEVLFTGEHHRKLAIIDRKILWEGSLNILSQADSCEIMRRIESEQLAQQMIEFVRLDRYVA